MEKNLEWKDKRLADKTILPENQRVIIVNLTDEGKRIVEQIQETELKVYKAISTSLDLLSKYNDFFTQSIQKSIEFFDNQLGLT